jgi:DNA-binding transcriptional MerR regulator
MSESPRTLGAGELARLAGISTDTLRHYERLGILPSVPRTASGYRRYAPDSLERVKLVRHALQLGFTLQELADILRVRDKGGVPCQQVLKMLHEKLDALGQRITGLQLTQRYMQSLVAEWSSKIAQLQPGKRAHLLQTVETVPGSPAKTRPELKGRKQA